MTGHIRPELPDRVHPGRLVRRHGIYLTAVASGNDHGLLQRIIFPQMLEAPAHLLFRKGETLPERHGGCLMIEA